MGTKNEGTRLPVPQGMENFGARETILGGVEVLCTSFIPEVEVVKGKRKPLEEIKSSIDAFNNILIVGCGGCVSVCLAGGQKETNTLKADLTLLYKQEKARKGLKTFTIERQCNMQFLVELDEIVKYLRKNK